ncbi:translational activator of cytochrome c oxidase 1-like [Anneissia japonica]|uniref:translational activator of cytochrome c oxidase 1-like n=1 Tax=Anneissia japonica TaxID=1529436 RepID=UPI0014258248|nr:translational activator of cytochrome c oxidase 1-like [Anneissia japonica]
MNSVKRIPLLIKGINSPVLRSLIHLGNLSNTCQYHPGLWEYSACNPYSLNSSPELKSRTNVTLTTHCSCQPCSGVVHLQMRALHVSRRCSAGHNKWSKVKHIKGPKDQQRGTMISKLVKQIRIAIRDGGPNPTSNSALSHAINVAKEKGVPKATIENTLNNASKSKSYGTVLEAKGPLGCLFLIDVSSDQVLRTKAELSKILNKHGGSMLDSGGATRAFSKKGILKVPAQTSEHNLSEEDAMDVAIEAGAEDVELTEDEDSKMSFMFYCDPKDIKEVRTNLISLQYVPDSTNIDYIVENAQSLDSSTLEKASRLVEVLEENQNVMRVYHNIAAEEES